MAKSTTASAAVATKPKFKSFKVAALEVTVRGQYIVRQEKNKTPKPYTEVFFIPAAFRDRPLQVVRRCLIEERLKVKYDSFTDVRACELVGRPKETEYEFGEFVNKDVYELSGEELRSFILFKGIKYPVIRHNPETKKKEVSYYLDPVEMIKRTNLDIDLAEKALFALKENPRARMQEELAEEEETEGVEESEGLSKKGKEKWENLDDSE